MKDRGKKDSEFSCTDRLFDVAVAGGGLAGVMAAVAAAREGKQVILIEKYGYFGGMATVGLVYPFMRHYTLPEKKPVNAGLYFRLLEEIYAIGGSAEPHSRHYKEEFIKIVLDRMVKACGIKVLFHAKLCEVKHEGRKIENITVATVSGMLKIRAKIFVDATGNADLCAFAGLPYQLGRREDGLVQPMTLCFRLGNVDWSRFDLAGATRQRERSKIHGRISWLFGILLIISCILIPREPLDMILPMQSRLQRLRCCCASRCWYLFMKQNIPGMEQCELLSSAVEAGIRESRRIISPSRTFRETGIIIFGMTIISPLFPKPGLSSAFERTVLYVTS